MIAKKCMRAHVTELVHTGESGTNHLVGQVHVPGQRGVVRQDRLVADNTVVRDMDIRHEQVVIADNGVSGILDRAATDSTEFTKRIALANRQARRLIRVFQILRIVTDRRELVDVIVLADFRGPVDNDVTVDYGASVDFHTIRDDSVRTDLNTFCDDGTVRNNGGGMDHFSSFLTRSIRRPRRRNRASCFAQVRTGCAGKLAA